jgi:RecA/RadA recombinase
MANKWMAQLAKMSGAVTEQVDIHSNVIRTPSPSVNFIYGNSHGLPRGYSALFWGPAGGGKSLLANATIGQMHRDSKDLIAIKFDAERRSKGQLNDRTAAAFGVDRKRLMVFEVSSSVDIFDRIAKQIYDLVKDGMPLGLIILDSVNAILGRREENSKSVADYLIGDHAQTLQIGLKKILPVQRDHDISLIAIAQQRAEMDMHEQRRGNSTKAAVSHACRHHCEYFVYVERNKTRAGRTDELGNALEDKSKKDLGGTSGDAETTGHKVRVWMEKSSFGGAGRTGEFVLDYRNGIIKVNEEIFRLGENQEIITQQGKYYVINGEKFHGKAKAIEALERPDLQKFVIKTLLENEQAQRIIGKKGHTVNLDDVATAEDIDKAFEDTSVEDETETEEAEDGE